MTDHSTHNRTAVRSVVARCPCVACRGGVDAFSVQASVSDLDMCRSVVAKDKMAAVADTLKSLHRLGTYFGQVLSAHLLQRFEVTLQHTDP